jgi:hypothetical protein
MVYRDVNIYCRASSHADVSSQGAIPWMIGNVVVVNIFALSYFIVDLLLRIPNTQKRNDWYSHGDSRFCAQSFILVSDRIDDLVKIAVCVVGFVGNHFEHPRAVLKH